MPRTHPAPRRRAEGSDATRPGAPRLPPARAHPCAATHPRGRRRAHRRLEGKGEDAARQRGDCMREGHHVGETMREGRALGTASRARCGHPPAFGTHRPRLTSQRTAGAHAPSSASRSTNTLSGRVAPDRTTTTSWRPSAAADPRAVPRYRENESGASRSSGIAASLLETSYASTRAAPRNSSANGRLNPYTSTTSFSCVT